MRRSLILSLLILFFLCSLVVLIPDASAWERRVVEFPGQSGRAEHIALDPAGDVIAVGHVNGGEVTKLSGATGEIIWRIKPNHPEAPIQPSNVAVDSKGDIFVVFVGNRSVLKLSGADGMQIWRKPIGGTVNAFTDYISALEIGLDDNVVTAGVIGGQFNVCKLRGTDGTELWHHEQEGYAYAVAVDPVGDIAAAGVMNKNFGVIKLRGEDGQKLWQNELNGVGTWTNVFEQANAVVMDTDGSVIAVGKTSNMVANVGDFTVVKYASDGEQQWVHKIDGGGIRNRAGETVYQANDEAHVVVLGKDGSVFAAGTLQSDWDPEIPGTNEHFHVFKFDRDGSIVWGAPAEYPSPGEEYTRGRALAVSVDEAGNVVAAGQHNLRFTVVKFVGGGARAGERVWLQQPGQPPTPGNHTTALDVATDADNNVVVSGELLGPDSFSNFTVVKLWGANGESYFGPPESAPTSYVPETVLKYAPIVHLYSNDKYRPGDPATFIYNSDLFWFHEGECGQDLIEARAKIESKRLGTGDWAYFHNAILPRTSQDSSCVHSNKVFYASDYTRPYDGGKRSSPENRYWWDNPFYEREGFYLDLRDDNTLRHGIPHIPDSPVYPGAPVFFEYVPRQYVTYWFFYPYDEFSFPDGVNLQFHEGDWERVSVQLNEDDEPLNVFYYSHDDGMRVSWTEIERFETHPVLYSAKGSHASYPSPGSHFTSAGLPDLTNSGPEWHTWNNLLSVEAQPWFGFGGAWGQVGEPHLLIPGKDYTGPLGPSKYKNSKGIWVRSISGRVTTTDGNGLAGVKVTLADALGNTIYTITDEAGIYSFQYLRVGREYTVSPAREGYSFTPPSRTFSYLTENQTANFAVLDLLPPVLSLPAYLTANASTPLGAVVTYSVTATDNITKSPRISCQPQSGDIFAIGITIVTCTAVDDANNIARGSFKVTIKGAAEQITDLISLVQQINLKKSDAQRLVNNLEQAQKALSRGDKGKACRDIEQFIKEVMKELGKGLAPEQGKRLGDAAIQIRAVIDCR